MAYKWTMYRVYQHFFATNTYTAQCPTNEVLITHLSYPFSIFYLLSLEGFKEYLQCLQTCWPPYGLAWQELLWPRHTAADRKCPYLYRSRSVHKSLVFVVNTLPSLHLSNAKSHHIKIMISQLFLSLAKILSNRSEKKLICMYHSN